MTFIVLSWVFFVVGWAVYIRRFRREIYRSYPMATFFFLLLALALAVYQVISAGGFWGWVTLGIEGAIIAVFAWYMFVYSFTPRKRVALREGDMMPDIRLPTSDGTTFSPRDMIGRRAVLYDFYRGDW